MKAKRKLTVEVSDEVYRLLKVVTGSPEETLSELVDHAQQGVYRPGAWEREWLCQAFGYDWLSNLVPGDPYGRDDCDDIFTRPKQDQG